MILSSGWVTCNTCTTAAQENISLKKSSLFLSLSIWSTWCISVDDKQFLLMKKRLTENLIWSTHWSRVLRGGQRAWKEFSCIATTLPFAFNSFHSAFPKEKTTLQWNVSAMCQIQHDTGSNSTTAAVSQPALSGHFLVCSKSYSIPACWLGYKSPFLCDRSNP